MRNIYKLALILLPVVLLALSGCGGSSGSSSASDPFASPSTGTGPKAGTIFGNISTTAGKTGITLKTDRATVDVNNGQVLVTANVVSAGVMVPGVPVTFAIVAPVSGPATIGTGLTTVTTDSNGVAITRITTGNALITTNVIVSATAAIGTQTAIANTTFQIARGGGVIMFTDLAGKLPLTQSNMYPLDSKEVDPTLGPTWSFMQLIPFKVTDSNLNPRVGVPVTLSVYSITTRDPSDVTIDFLVPPLTEPNQQTITSDSAGQGIFNGTVKMTTPDPGGVNIVDVVFKAVTNDAIPVTAYLAASYSLTAKLPVLVLAPGNATFGDSTDLTFTISGGVAPYKVTSNKTNRVQATLNNDGVSITAHLADLTQWSDEVTISVTDSKSQTASATVSR